MNTLNTPLLVLALLGTLTTAAQAAPNDGIVGPYARIEVGGSHFGLSGAALQPGSDDHGRAARVFGGYRFDEGFGVELGYAALGAFRARTGVGAALVQQDGRARSLFGVVTGRLPVGESWAVHGRLGLSSGKVGGDPSQPPGQTLTGSRTSLLWGLGAEYRPRANLAFTLNHDHYGRLSDQVKASALLFGVHFTL